MSEWREGDTPLTLGRRALKEVEAAKDPQELNLPVGAIFAANDRNLLLELIEVIKKKELETSILWLTPEDRRTIGLKLGMDL